MSVRCFGIGVVGLVYSCADGRCVGGMYSPLCVGMCARGWSGGDSYSFFVYLSVIVVVYCYGGRVVCCVVCLCRVVV